MASHFIQLAGWLANHLSSMSTAIHYNTLLTSHRKRDGNLEERESCKIDREEENEKVITVSVLSISSLSLFLSRSLERLQKLAGWLAGQLVIWIHLSLVLELAS